MTTTSNLPKSLKTVTTIVNVARHIWISAPIGTIPEACVITALTILGYTLDQDTHGLAEKAANIMRQSI